MTGLVLSLPRATVPAAVGTQMRRRPQRALRRTARPITRAHIAVRQGRLGEQCLRRTGILRWTGCGPCGLWRACRSRDGMADVSPTSHSSARSCAALRRRSEKVLGTSMARGVVAARQLEQAMLSGALVAR
jgi:hypothetical protein